MADEEVLRASIVIDVRKAISAYTEARQAHISMVTALNTGAGALTTVGAAFTAAGVSMAAGIWMAVNAAGEFERKLDFFGAVSDASVKDMEAIRKKALELGADSIYSADQVADAFTNLAKSGVNAQGILAGIGEAVISLGAATDMPLETAATSLTTVLNTFGIAAEDSVAVVDKLAGAANSSAIEVEDLILTLTYAGASAKVAGVGFDEVNTAIAVLGERGIKGSKAGTGLRQMFDKLLAPTNKGKDALKELGIVTEDGTNKLIDLDGGLKPLPDVLDTLNAAIAPLSTAEKMDLLGNIFPITSLPTILSLLDGGSDAMARLNGEIGKTTAADIAAERLDNLSGDVEILRGNFQTLVISIGDTQTALARGLVQALISVVDWLNSLSPKMLGLIVTLAEIAAVLLVVIGVMGMFSGFILNIIALAIRIADSWGFIVGVLQAVGNGIIRLGLLFTNLPLLILIAGIALLVTALIQFFTKTQEGAALLQQFGQIFGDAFAQMVPLFQTLGSAFGQLMATLIPVIMQLITVLVGGLVQALIALTPLFVFLAEVIADVLLVAVQLLVPFLTMLVELLTGPLGGVLLALGGIILTVVAAIRIWAVAQAILNFALTANPIGVIIMAIAALVAAIIWVATETTFFQDLWANVSAFFIAVWTNISSFFITIWTNISSFFMGIWNGIVAFFTPIITVIYNVIKFYVEAWINIFLIFAAVLVTIWNAIVTAVQWAWNLIWGFIGPIVTAIVSFITDTINNLMIGWQIVWGAISSFFTDVWNNLLSFLLPIVINIQRFITNMVTTVQGIWNNVWGAISSFFTSIWQNFVGAVKGPVDTIFGIIGGIQGTIMGFFRGVGSWLYNTGRQVIEGLINGISSMFQGIVNAISDVVNGAIDWAKDVLGIASPSKVFAEIGVNTILGMINGVKATAPVLERTMNAVSSGLDSFYDQVYAAREMDVMLNLQSQMGIDAYSASQANQLALLNEKLEEIADKDTFNIEKLEVNNPEPEPTSESLPNAIRKTAYVVG